jgi:hypothetical protein
MMPVMAYDLLESIALLAAVSRPTPPNFSFSRRTKDRTSGTST